MIENPTGNVAPTARPAQSEPSSQRAGRGVNNLGYRKWSGRLVPGWTRWMVISTVGTQRAWQSMWLRRMLFFAWLPAVWFGLGFFLWEQTALYPGMRDALIPFLRGMPQTPQFDGIREAILGGNTEQSRHAVWAWLLQTFFRHPQGVLMVMMVGMIGPPLISQDIRSRAFLLYFSRPLTRVEYLVGKLATLCTYLFFISTLPALSLYLVGVLLSPNLEVVSVTWDIPLRILGASVVLMVPTSVLALCLSSMTQETRYAGFAWFALWILGFFTYVAATFPATVNAQQAGRSGRVVVIEDSAWSHLSMYHTLGRVQQWVFGFANFSDVLASIVILIAITVAALAILYYRISAPMRV